MTPVLWALSPMLILGPALTCVAPRIMALLFIACGVFAVAADLYARRAKPEFDKGLLALFGAFLAYAAVSQIWTIAPGETLEKAQSISVIFGLVILLTPIIARFSAEELRRLGMMVGAGFCVGFGVYVFEMLNNFMLYDLTHGGSSTDVVDVRQNKSGVLLTFWLYMAFPYFWMGAKKSMRIAYAAMAVLFYAAMFFSKSASAQVVMLGVPFFIAFLYYAPTLISRRLALGVMTVLAISMPFIALEMAKDKAVLQDRTISNSVRSRIEIWDQAARRTMEKPILGWGFDASPELPNRGELTADPDSAGKHRPIKHLHPHNALIQIWFEMGAVGIAGLIALFALIYRRIGNIVSTAAQRYAIFMWPVTFLYTLSIWGIWQSWFVSSLCLMGLMTYAGVRKITQIADQ